MWQASFAPHWCASLPRVTIQVRLERFQQGVVQHPTWPFVVVFSAFTVG
jgi:hypothetical protein